MSTRSTDRRYTVMVVPESGRGEVYQRSVPVRRVYQAVGGTGVVVALLLGTAMAHAWTLPRAMERDELRAENDALKVRLAQVDKRIAEIEPLVERVRAYDDQLRDLAAREALPGFGPLDSEEAAARKAWIDGVVPDLPDGEDDETPEARLGGIEDNLAVLEPHISDYPRLLAQFGGVQAALPQLWPVEGVLTSPFGYRTSPFGHQWKMHTGLDIGATWGSPIFATNDGLVTFAGWDSGHGNTVEIDHGHGVTTRYCHASRILVDAGDLVASGEEIALVGSTGMSTGPHLHYEILVDGEKVDPLPYLP